MISASQQELFDLRERVNALELAIAPAKLRTSTDDAIILRDQVLAITQDLFNGQVQVVEASDPEILGDTHFIFRVVAHGTLDELASKHDEWHRRLRDIATSFPGIFRLAIDAQ